MIIKKVSIKNWGSLRDVQLDDLANFVAVLGKNGSGKSFLFEALHWFLERFD